MKKRRFLMYVAIILMAVGFAAVSTTLFLNGNTNVATNQADFDVYFSKVIENGIENTNLIVDKTHIAFEANLKEIDEVYELRYEVTNASKNYDVSVSIHVPNGNEYLQVTNDFDTSNLLARSTRIGNLTLKVIKGVTEEIQIPIEITITVNAVERTILGDEKILKEEIFFRGPLYNLLKSSSLGEDKALGIDYNAISSSTNGEGVYSTLGENDEVVYFYRGNIENNHIIFANNCWQIVRTTEKGGTKIIYSGIPKDGTCQNKDTVDLSIGKSMWNKNANDNAYVGYMYGIVGSNNHKDTHENINDSDIKMAIDAWYEIHLKDTSYESLLEDAVWCNDRTTINNANYTHPWGNIGTLGYGQNYTAYGGLARSSYWTNNVSPSLVCPAENDRFTVFLENGNGKLTYPIALLTSDEMVYAGLTSAKMVNGSEKKVYQNSDYYLYTKEYIWHLTPHVYGTYGASISISSSSLNGAYVNSINGTFGASAYIRPSIVLNAKARITNGKGTREEPYFVE